MKGGRKTPSSTRRNQRIAKAPKIATGVLSSTLNGSDQLSYSAARMRKTNSRESPKTTTGGTPSRAFCPSRLFVALPLTADPVEIVDEISPHEGLDCPVDVVEGHTLFQHFVAVHLNEFLRHAGQEGSAQAGDLGALAGGLEEGA